MRHPKPKLAVNWIWVSLALAGSLGGLIAQPAPREEASALFQKATALYLADQFEEASKIYENILSQGWESGELNFNLGNAYYRQGKVGPAILNYERALHYLPGDSDVLRNLELANLKVVDKIEPLAEFLPLRWAKNLLQSLTLSNWLWLALLFYWGASLLLTGWILSTSSALRRWMAAAAAGSAGAALLSFLLFAGSFWLEQSEVPAIIMTAEVPARSAPGAGASEVFRIHEGTRVRTGKRGQDWTEIILADGKVGWIPSQALEII